MAFPQTTPRSIVLVARLFPLFAGRFFPAVVVIVVVIVVVVFVVVVVDPPSTPSFVPGAGSAFPPTGARATAAPVAVAVVAAPGPEAAIRDRHPLHRDGPAAPLGVHARRVAHHLHPLDHPSERHVLPVEVGGATERDEELRAVGVLAAIGHAQHPLRVVGYGEILVGEGGGLVVAFRRRRRRGTTAGAVEILVIATLDHEARDDAMEYRAPIRRGGSPHLPLRPPNRRGGRSTKGGEISARYWALVGTELDYYPSGRRPGHGDAEMAEHSRIGDFGQHSFRLTSALSSSNFVKSSDEFHFLLSLFHHD